jgi:hypothetical protein
MMRSRMGAIAAALATVAVAVTTVVAPAGAAPASASTPSSTRTSTSTSESGWVVENPRVDGLYETNEGSVTIANVTTGATISCSGVSGWWGRADSGTIRPQDWFANSGVTVYDACTGPGPADLQVISTPDLVFLADSYDAGADRVSGTAYPLTWGLFLDSPDCQVDMYAPDADVSAPLTYDNPTGTLDVEPVEVVATRAEGPGCAGVAAVGDVLTFATTLVLTPAFTVRPAN